MKTISRRSFGAQMLQSAVAAGAALAATNTAQAQRVWNKQQWKVAEFDKLVSDKAEIKQLYDVSEIAPFTGIKNSINGLQVGFGIPAGEIRTIVAMHHKPALLALDDSMWAKYKLGEAFDIKDPESGKPATRNFMYKSAFPAVPLTGDANDMKSAWHDQSIEGLHRRGTFFLACHNALEGLVIELIEKNHLTTERETIAQEMVAHTLPGCQFVVSKSSAMAVLQNKGHYAYMKG